MTNTAHAVTLVTGASSGLGEEFARQLAAKKKNLVITARSGDKLAALAAELTQKHGVSVDVIALDLGAPGGAAGLCEALDALGHEVDELVSNAGFGSSGPVERSDAARQMEMVRLNCEALVGLTCHFLPGMVARGRGGILHVASLAGFQSTPFMATYGATKAFVLNFSEAISEEVRGSGVRVSALCPGPVPTGFQAVARGSISPSQSSAVLSAEVTVQRGLVDWERGKTICVPGLGNNISLLGSRLLPRPLLVRAVGRMMRAKKRD